MPLADVGGQQLAAVLQDDRAQHRALREREALPQRFEHGLLLGEQAHQRLMEIVERRAAASSRPHVVPGFVRQPLDVVGEIAGQLDDRGAEPGLGADARIG